MLKIRAGVGGEGALSLSLSVQPLSLSATCSYLGTILPQKSLPWLAAVEMVTAQLFWSSPDSTLRVVQVGLPESGSETCFIIFPQVFSSYDLSLST